MVAEKAYYSIIQFCPEPSRGESANIGVALFCPNLKYLDAKLSKGNDRVRRFFSQDTKLNLSRLNESKMAIRDLLLNSSKWIKSLEHFKEFSGKMANEIIFTVPRPCKAFDPEKDLDDLYNELVGGRTLTNIKKKIDFPEVDMIFKSPTLTNRVKFNQRIEVPIINKEIKIPYMYRNGFVNLVKPQVFSIVSGQETALSLATKGRLIMRESSGLERRLIVIPYIEGRSTKFAKQIREVLNDSKIRTYRKNELAKLASEVEAEAKTIENDN